MLTRIEVARRLGKSVATVRRMEGTMLHPRRDYAGVHRFDLKEIERVIETIRESTGGERRRSRWFGDRKELRDEAAELTATNDELDGTCRNGGDCSSDARSLIERVLVLEEELRKREQEDAIRAAQARRDNGELVESVIRLLGGLSNWELRRLGDEYLDAVSSLLDKMCADL
jgi:hypothetical protein